VTAFGSLTFTQAHRLIKTGNLVALRRALDDGLNPDLSNQFSWTLLMLTGIRGNTSIGRLLISRGANLDRVNRSGETALSLAAQQGHLPFVRLLLSYGASIECRPHGHSVEQWVTMSSGLPPHKIASILAAINLRRLH
jgi:ankyrin repeat protein